MGTSIDSPGEPIARGRNAEIYPWGEGRVLKLFVDWLPAEVAEEEALRAQVARAAGVPVPQVVEQVEVGGRRGVVYERIEGPSMLAVLWRKPWLLRKLAHCCADLHSTMHACSVPELRSFHQQARQKIEQADPLPAEMKRAVLAMLDSLPDDDKLLHMDFGPENVLMTAQGPVVIDWMIAVQGCPWAGVARTSLVAGKETLPTTVYNWLFKVASCLFRRAYLARYLQSHPDGHRQLAAWRPVIAADRLWERIPEEESRLLALVERGISQSA